YRGCDLDDGRRAGRHRGSSARGPERGGPSGTLGGPLRHELRGRAGLTGAGSRPGPGRAEPRRPGGHGGGSQPEASAVVGGLLGGADGEGSAEVVGWARGWLLGGDGVDVVAFSSSGDRGVAGFFVEGVVAEHEGDVAGHALAL